jgi:hypothetical protein
MRLTSPAAKLVSAILLLATSATLSQAIGIAVRVRGASNYGIGPDFSGCVARIRQCGEGFNLVPTTVTFNGINYNIYQFAFDPGFDPTPTGVNILNLIDLGSIGPNTTFTLPPGFFDPAFTEIFSCNDLFTPSQGGSQATFDSSGKTLTGPCTPGLTSTPDLTLNADGSFTTGRAFNVFNLVLDSPVSAVTPEPASLVLLGAGLVAFGRKLRRAS